MTKSKWKATILLTPSFLTDNCFREQLNLHLKRYPTHQIQRVWDHCATSPNYQALNRALCMEVRLKYFATRRILNSLLGIWKYDQTRCFVFHIILLELIISRTRFCLPLRFKESGCHCTWRGMAVTLYRYRFSWTKITESILNPTPCLDCCF